MKLSRTNKHLDTILLVSLLGATLVFSACASDTSGPIGVPTGEPVSAQILGSDIAVNAVDSQLVSKAVSDAKNTIGKSISFHKAIKTEHGDVLYIFLIDRVDDNFLVYQLNKANTQFTRKFYYFSLRL